MSKVSIQLGRYSNDSSMSPVWHNAIKETCERSAWSHIHLSTRLQELLRDVQSYNYELRKKRKRMKEIEARTETVVEQFRASKAQLQRTREVYMNLAMDVDRLKKGSTSSDAANVSGDKQVYNASTMPLQQSHSATNFPIGMMLSSPQRVIF
jgi:DNA repair exonuclease SbcCD ATPase subunit